MKFNNYSRKAYELAMILFKQGMECDEAARVIRETFDDYSESVIAEVKKRMGDDFNPTFQKEEIY